MNLLSGSRVRASILVFSLASGAALAASAQQQQPVPITNDTPAQTTRPETTPLPGSGAAVAPMTKSQMKAQKKQEKANEKAANANAKAAKSQAKAEKQSDKATRAQEKAAQPQP